MNTGRKPRFGEKFFARRDPRLFFKDIFGGIIVALVSIPISMGYAQIAGLPMQYGLYGSVLPILLFGLMTGSRDFVFGVDAAPAALVGTSLAALGIQSESEQAMSAVPLLALFVSFWLLIFFFLRAGRMVKYISEPVMGGFVTGICCTIILMQVPKLFGGTAGIGEAPELIANIFGQLDDFNGWSMLMGCSVIFIITLFRRLAPKIPMSVIIMAAGAVLGGLAPLSDIGVRMLPDTGGAGFPLPSLPDVRVISDHISELLFDSLSIAAVILSESLLASRSNASRDGYRLDPNREILSYSLANFSAALSGCCPVNGSVSRTGIVRQFGVRSQWMSVFAAVTMLLILLFGTSFIGLLPVPVLTAIVISALMGACDFGLARRMLKLSRQDFLIFMAAFFGVLIFGTVYGVIIGIVLSFFAVIKKTVTPPRSFLGVIPGRTGFYPLDRSHEARPFLRAVIYRFGGSLYFANIGTLRSDLEKAVTPETTCIVIHAGAVSSIDVAAAEELLSLYRSYREKGIRLYLAEHMGALNDSLRKYGAGELITGGAVRMTVELALRDADIRSPYEPQLADAADSGRRPEESDGQKGSAKGLQAELEWAFGEDSETFKENLTEEIYQSIKQNRELDADTIEKLESLSRWGRLNFYDEEELLDRLETRLLDRAIRHPDQAERIEAVIEERRRIIEERMPRMDPQAPERIRRRRLEYARELYRKDPAAFERRKRLRLARLDSLQKANPSLAERYRRVYGELMSVSFDNAEQEKPDDNR